MQQTKDGKKKFGSAFVAKRYDEAHSEEPSDEKGAKKKLGNVLEDRKNDLAEEVGEKNDSPKEEQGEGETHPVVSEHGPATDVHIHHDHKNNKHTVTSHHEDGHTNVSDHEDAQTAHQEGGKLANVSLKKSGEAEDQQLAESEGGNDSVPDGFEMPPLV